VKLISREELSENKGVDGNRALVAVNGKVYDVTPSKKWPAGNHMKRHQAGADLSADILSAPHGLDVLERFETIGSLVSEEKSHFTGPRAQAEALLNAYPWFRRHPHPAVVHFPLGFLMGAPFRETLALL
jgi:predicted heme/steroid binding protein